jgi:hypothetical protein
MMPATMAPVTPATMAPATPSLTLADRANAYNAQYSHWPASRLHVDHEQGREVLYGWWVIGNDYRNPSRYFGAYPRGFVDRVMSLFPDAAADTTLHAFAGSVPAGPYVRCDLQGDVEARYSVLELPDHFGRVFSLILADPPYSAADAAKYSTPPVDRRRALAALAAVAAPGAHLGWLDCCWPMHSKQQWVTVGRIAVCRSTNHKIRQLTLFTRTEAE